MLTIARKTVIYSVLFCSLFIIAPVETPCRPLIVSASGSISTTYNSNIYNTKENQLSEWKSSFSPSLIFNMPEEKATINLTLSPSYTLNHRTDEYSLVYGVNAIYERDISSRLNFGLSNNYSYFDNPPSEPITAQNLAMQFVQLEPEVQDEIVRLLFDGYIWPGGGDFDRTDPLHLYIVQLEIQTEYDNAPPSLQAQVDALLVVDTASRRHYWSDTVGLTGVYEYNPGGSITLGYSYSINRYDTSNQSDSEKHDASIAFQHQYSEQLDFNGSYGYTTTTYDKSEDSQTHNRNVGLGYKFNYENTLTGSLNNSETQYSGVQRGNSRYGLTLGFDHKFSSTANINISTSPYRTNKEAGSDERGYGLDIGLSQSLMRGGMNFNASSSFSDRKVGEGWDSFRRSWSFGVRMNYEFIEALPSNVSFSYGEQEYRTSDTKNVSSDYAAGFGISYPLGSLFNLSLTYRFDRLDPGTDQIEDYYNNTVFLGLSASKELWR